MSVGRLVVISGPSGVGKDTLINRLRARDPLLRKVITCTTRPARPGEEQGRDYLFMGNDEFQVWVDEGRFLEHATVHGHRYGSPKAAIAELIADGYDVILKIDVQGALTVRSLDQQALLIFLAPPSMEELTRRRLSRDQDPGGAEERRRAADAVAEMAVRDQFDHVVLDDELESAVVEVAAVIHSRRHRGSSDAD